MVTLSSTKHFWPGRDARACCARDACHPRRARHHLGSFPALSACGEMQAVPRGARSKTRLLPASTSQPPLAGIRSVRNYNTGICLSSKNGPYIRTRLVTPQGKNEHSGSTTPTDAFALVSTSGRPSGGRAQAGLSLSAPMPTHPRQDPGPKRPMAPRPQTPHYSDPHVYCCYRLLLLLLCCC